MLRNFFSAVNINPLFTIAGIVAGEMVWGIPGMILAIPVMGMAKIIKVDVDKNREAAMQFNIQGVPTLILFKDGQVKWRQSGVVPAQTLVQLLNEHAE